MTLTHVLGNVPMIQVIDFMLEHIEHDITVKEIIEYTGVGATDMKRDFPGLVESGVVVETRKIGGVQLYLLNSSSEVVDALIDLDNVLSDHMSEKIAVAEMNEDPEMIEDPDAEDTDAEDPKKYPEGVEEWET